MARSAAEGSGLPQGWLWKAMTAAAFSRSARLTISRGVNLGAVHGAEEEVFDRQDGVLRVEKDAAEDFTVPVGAVGSEEGGGDGRVGDLALTLQLPAQDALGGFQDLLVSVGLLQPQAVRFHGEFSRGGSASWSRPGVPTARLRTHERARASAHSGAATEAARSGRGKSHHGRRSVNR